MSQASLFGDVDPPPATKPERILVGPEAFVETPLRCPSCGGRVKVDVQGGDDSGRPVDVSAWCENDYGFSGDSQACKLGSEARRLLEDEAGAWARSSLLVGTVNAAGLLRWP